MAPVPHTPVPNLDSRLCPFIMFRLPTLKGKTRSDCYVMRALGTGFAHYLLPHRIVGVNQVTVIGEAGLIICKDRAVVRNRIFEVVFVRLSSEPSVESARQGLPRRRTKNNKGLSCESRQ